MAASAADMQVSVIILTRNRKADVLENLAALSNQTRSHDIVLVDNASDDETAEAVRAKYPQAKVVALKENTGVAMGRNAGIEVATGDLLVFIDDDAVLKNKRALERIVTYFTQYPRLGVLGFQERNYYNPEEIIQWHFMGKSISKDAPREFEAHYFPGVGHAIRARVLKETGGAYPDYYFYSTEELDLSYRVLDAGYEIRYTPHVQVFHKRSPTTRANFRFYFDLRNHIWMSWRLFPQPYRTIHQLGWFARVTWQAALAGYLHAVPRAIRDAWKLRDAVLAERAPLKPETIKKIKKLRNSWQSWIYI